MTAEELAQRMADETDCMVDDGDRVSPKGLLVYASLLIQMRAALESLDSWSREGNPLTLLQRLVPIIGSARDALSSADTLLAKDSK